MRRALGVLALVLFAGLIWPAAAAEEDDLWVDLDVHQIEIGSRFTGTTLIMFGTTRLPGDVVVVVRGPSGPVTVRRKEPTLGFWFNRDSVEFKRVPLYYAFASSAPVDDILPAPIRAEHQIGLENLTIRPLEVEDPREIRAAREALIREQVRQARYPASAGVITFRGPNLFRVSLDFPASIPTGPYKVEVLLVRNGEIVAERTTPLIVSKIGVAAQLFVFAHHQAAAYAAIAIAAALLAGWLGYIIFRKV
jgi:uncharacterized protein (TIGR02186 family)